MYRFNDRKSTLRNDRVWAAAATARRISSVHRFRFETIVQRILDSNSFRRKYQRSYDFEKSKIVREYIGGKTMLNIINGTATDDDKILFKLSTVEEIYSNFGRNFLCINVAFARYEEDQLNLRISQNNNTEK